MSEQRDALIQHLATSIHCAVCAEGYQPENMAILGRRDRVWVVGISCAHCGTRALVFATIKLEETLASGEMTAEEVAIFSRRGPIQADEVERMREFLRNFQGDMHDLLGES